MKSAVLYYGFDKTLKSKFFITNFDKDAIKRMHDNGIEFYAIYDDKTEGKVSWEDVKKPGVLKDEVVKIPVISHNTFMMMMEPMIEAIGVLESGQSAQPIATLSTTSGRRSPSTPMHDSLLEIYNGIVDKFKDQDR